MAWDFHSDSVSIITDPKTIKKIKWNNQSVDSLRSANSTSYINQQWFIMAIGRSNKTLGIWRTEDTDERTHSKMLRKIRLSHKPSELWLSSNNKWLLIETFSKTSEPDRNNRRYFRTFSILDFETGQLVDSFTINKPKQYISNDVFIADNGSVTIACDFSYHINNSEKIPDIPLAENHTTIANTPDETPGSMTFQIYHSRINQTDNN